MKRPDTAFLFAVLAGLLPLGMPSAHAQAAAAIPDAASSAPDAQRALRRDALVQALRKGGHVIYFRHTATDFSRNDSGMTSYTDCANQRLLSEDGRVAARAIGERVRALRLPLGEVLASPYCRTMETATLALQRAEPRVEVREESGTNYAGLKRLLATPVPAGSNRWIFGHGTPFRSIAGPPHLAEGEAAVIKPEGNRWVVVARIAPDEWARLPDSR